MAFCLHASFHYLRVHVMRSDGLNETDIQPSLTEGRTGVFSRCMISWFYFPWYVNLENYSSWLMNWRFCLTHAEPELVTSIFVILPLYSTQILRHKFSEWLESSMQCNLGVQFAIWSLDLVIPDMLSWNTVSSVRTGYSKEHLTYFCDSGKQNFYICDSWSSILFLLWTVPEDPPPLYDPLDCVPKVNNVKPKYFKVMLQSLRSTQMPLSEKLW